MTTRARWCSKRGPTRRPWTLLSLAPLVLLLTRPDVRILGPKSGPEVERAPLVLLASGAYLDDLGQMSQTMSELMELLLQKVSFLAEIVIESALAEECEVSCSRQTGPRMNNGSQLPAPPTRIHLSQLDAREFNDRELLEYFWSSTVETKSLPKEAWPGAKAGAGIEAKAGAEAEAGLGTRAGVKVATTKDSGWQHLGGQLGASSAASCKLFGLSVERRDLPVNDMESCCLELNLCYTKCGNLKATCDLAFRDCLGSMCKNKFDYTNDSLVVRAMVSHQENRGQHQQQLSRQERQASSSSLDDGHQLSQYEPMVDDAELEEGQPMGGHVSREPHLDNDSHVSKPAEEEEEDNADEQHQDQQDRLVRRHARNGPMGSGVLVVESQQAGLPGARREAGSLTPASSSGSADSSSPSIEPDERKRKRLKDKYKACKLASKLLIIGNLAFTCQTYRQMQREACCDG